MPVYQCPIHRRWVDSEREAGCPECLQAGGGEARQARKRNQKPPVSARRTAARAKQKRKRRWLLRLLLMGLGASALALPPVQRLLRDQGLGEVADRAERVSSGVEEVATQVEGQARSAAERLGVGEERDEASGDPASPHPLAGEVVTLRTTQTAGGSGLAYLPPRSPNEPRPLLVWLHPANAEPREGIETLQPLAARHRFAVLAPEAHAQKAAGFALWDVGEGASYSDDEHHVLDCVGELLDDPRFTLDGDHVLIAGVAGGGQAALHLGTHEARFTHVAVLHEAPSLRGLGEGKPPVLLTAGQDDPERPEAKVREAWDALRGLGYPAQLSVTRGGVAIDAEEAETLVQFWLTVPQ